MSEILLEVTMGKGERHRNFDAEFKREVLRLMAEGNPAVKVAEDLGIRVDLIYAWRKQEKRKVRAVAFAESGGKELSPEEKLKALREELAATKRERDILKKPWPSSQKNPESLKYGIVRDQEEGFPVEEMCQCFQYPTANAVARSEAPPRGKTEVAKGKGSRRRSGKSTKTVKEARP